MIIMIVKIRQEKKIESKLPNSEYEMGIWKNVHYVANCKLRQNKHLNEFQFVEKQKKFKKLTSIWISSWIFQRDKKCKHFFNNQLG